MVKDDALKDQIFSPLEEKSLQRRGPSDEQ